MKCLLMVVLTILAAFVNAQVHPMVTTPVGLAWQRVYDLGQSHDDLVTDLNVDKLGNEYIIASNTITPWANAEVRKYGPTGSLLWRFPITSTNILLSKSAVDANLNVYVVGDVTPNGTLSSAAFVMKISPQGLPLWTKTIFSPSVTDMYAIDVNANPSGGVNVACSNGTGVPKRDLVLLEMDASGNVLQNPELTAITPDFIAFQKATGNCIIAGRERAINGGAWAAYSPAGTYVTGDHRDDFAAGADTYSYHFAAFTDAYDDLYVIRNQIKNPGDAQEETFQLQAFNPSYTSVWTASPTFGNLFGQFFSAYDLNHVTMVSLVATPDTNTFTMRFFGSAGAPAWSKVIPQPEQIGIDGTGGAFLIEQSGDYTNSGYTVQKYLPNGTADWLITSGPTLMHQVYVTRARMFGKTLRMASTYNYVNNQFDILATTYVVGTVMSSITFPVHTNIGGGTLAGSVKLNAPAPTGGAVVNVSSSNTAGVFVPSTVTIPAGQTTANFSIQAAAVDAPLMIGVSATYNTVIRSATITLNPSTLVSVVPSPNSVKGGTSVTCTVSLNGACGLAGRTIHLSSNNASATVPSTVTIAPGANKATFTIVTHAVAANTVVTISAKEGSVTKTGALTVKP